MPESECTVLATRRTVYPAFVRRSVLAAYRLDVALVLAIFETRIDFRNGTLLEMDVKSRVVHLYIGKC